MTIPKSLQKTLKERAAVPVVMGRRWVVCITCGRALPKKCMATKSECIECRADRMVRASIKELKRAVVGRKGARNKLRKELDYQRAVERSARARAGEK